MPFDPNAQLPPLPAGAFQSLANGMGQPQASYAYNPVTDDMPFDVSMLGEDVMGTPLDRSMGDQLDMYGGMGMGMEGMEMEGPEMEGMEEPDKLNDPQAREMATAALQQKATQKQAASDMFQSNATKLARTMRGPQNL